METNLSFTNTTLATPPEMDERSSEVDIQHLILYVMLCFFSVLGVIGNAVAFYIFIMRRNTSTSVIFILALAGADFITCLVTVPFTVVFEAMHYQLYYDGLCKLYMFFITSTIPFSSLIMAGIAVDRYFCICHPFLHVLNVPRARLAVLCLAMPAFTFGIITSMSHGIYLVQDSLLLNGSFLVGTNISKERAENPQMPVVFLNVSELDRVTGGHVVETGVELKDESRVYPVKAYRKVVQNPECTMNEFYFGVEFQAWFHRIYTSCYILCFIIVMVLYVLIYKSIFTRRAMKAKRRKKNYYTSVAHTDAHAPAPAAKTRTHGDADTVLSELNGNGSGSGSGPLTTSTTTSTATAAATTTTTTTTTTTFQATTIPSTTTTTTINSDDEDGDNVTTSTSLIEPPQPQQQQQQSQQPLLEQQTPAPDSVVDKNDAEENTDGARKSNGTTAAAGGDNTGETTRVPKRRGSATRDRNLYANIKTAMMLFVVTLVFIVAFAPASFMAHQIIPMQLNVFYMYFVYNVANPFIYAFMNQSFRDDLKKLLKRS